MRHEYANLTMSIDNGYADPQFLTPQFLGRDGYHFTTRLSLF